MEEELLIMDSEYHRRRAEMEMERALQAKRPDEAMLHLELARIHREKRERASLAWRETARSSRPPINRTDKES
jgi:hypothetical protein